MLKQKNRNDCMENDLTYAKTACTVNADGKRLLNLSARMQHAVQRELDVRLVHRSHQHDNTSVGREVRLGPLGF